MKLMVGNDDERLKILQLNVIVSRVRLRPTASALDLDVLGCDLENSTH